MLDSCQTNSEQLVTLEPLDLINAHLYEIYSKLKFLISLVIEGDLATLQNIWF